MKVASWGRALRTVRHLRARQAWAQLQHYLHSDSLPVELGELQAGWVEREVSVPFLPAPPHARWDPAGTLELIHRSYVYDSRVDWDFTAEGPLWAYHLHQFDYARGLDIPSPERARLILDWIARHSSGTGWSPHPTSLRILSWGKLLLTPGALELSADERRQVTASLVHQIESLRHGLEVRLQGNHLLSNLIGVVFGGLLFEGPRADRWLSLESQLRRELRAQILPDGGHEERSPMYHSLLFENLLDLLNLARAANDRAPSILVGMLEDTAIRMWRALDLWTHPDGQIALFADSAFDIAHAPEILGAYATALELPRSSDPPKLLADSGTLRLQAGPLTLLASVAGPAPPHQPGHAHCDALAFELSLGAERIVTDTGVTEYLPGALRDLSRATLSHATAEVGGAEQAEVWSAHRVGGRPAVALEQVEPGLHAVACCAGWSTPDTLHRRSFAVEGDGIRIRDAIVGRARPVRFALPLAPELAVSLEPRPEGAAAMQVKIETPALQRLTVHLPEGVAWRVESRAYFPRFGEQLERPCLLGEASDFREGDWFFSWAATR